MNTNPLIISALSAIGIPVEPLKYTGYATEYIVFNDADNRATGFANDEDVQETAWVQVHYFTKTNPKVKAKQIRKALRNAGFIYLSKSESYEDDTGFYHTIIEARITAASETQEDDY